MKQALERRAEKTFSNVTAVVVSVLVEGLKEELEKLARKGKK